MSVVKFSTVQMLASWCWSSVALASPQQKFLSSKQWFYTLIYNSGEISEDNVDYIVHL